jgi:phytoene synthase
MSVTTLEAQDAEQVMAENGRSFYFASLIFSAGQRQQVAQLYRICRYVDDCADELSPVESRQAMQRIITELKDPASESEFQQAIRQLENKGVKREYLAELVDGALFDIDSGKIIDRKQLIIYCYRVAGVVGLMMCPLLGVKDVKANAFAIDLGIGMQLTNICRDILEDAQNERNYLPADELYQVGLSMHEIQQQGATHESLKSLVNIYLDLADDYYKSGYQGLAFIPLRPRICILVAGEIYRSIGHKIRKNNYQVLDGRTILSTYEKIIVTVKTLPRIFFPSFWRHGKHMSELHQSLHGLPGVNDT